MRRKFRTFIPSFKREIRHCLIVWTGWLSNNDDPSPILGLVVWEIPAEWVPVMGNCSRSGYKILYLLELGGGSSLVHQNLLCTEICWSTLFGYNIKCGSSANFSAHQIPVHSIFQCTREEPPLLPGSTLWCTTSMVLVVGHWWTWTWSCHYCASAHSVSRVQIQDPSSGGKSGVLIPWCTYSCHVLEYRMVVEVVVVKVNWCWVAPLSQWVECGLDLGLCLHSLCKQWYTIIVSLYIPSLPA